MKLFSTKTHGIVDYVTAGALVALPRIAGWSEEVTRFMTVMALGTVAYSALTDYECGVVKALPMTGHLVLDGSSGALFCAAPLVFPDEAASVKVTLVGIGLFELMASLCTETEPEHVHIHTFAR